MEAVHEETASREPRVGPMRLLLAAVVVALAAKLVVMGLAWHGGLTGEAIAAAEAPLRRASDGAEGGPGAAGTGASGEAARSAALARSSSHRELRSLIDAVGQRRAELDAREEKVARREEDLSRFQRDVEAKITQLEAVEKRLGLASEKERAAKEQAAASLAKVYSTMKPADAAPILNELDDVIVLRIFRGMKAKEVGLILPLMAREKAILLTRSLAGKG